MPIPNWLRKQLGRAQRSTSARSEKRRLPTLRPRVEPLEDRCLLTGGVLDPTFGTGGVVSSSLDASVRANSVATYPQAGTANDGKIVVGGEFAGSNHKLQFAVVRYNLDGSLDTSFGGTGEVTGPATDSWGAQGLVVQRDGKVLAAGESNGDFALVRYNADGSLDKSFGTRGVAKTAIGANSFDLIFAIALQPDGKIVAVGGTTLANSSSREIVLARYNANGTLDATFGKGGLALDHVPTSPAAGGGTERMGIALDPSTGQIVVQAASSKSMPVGYAAMVLRYTSGGVLDKSFGGIGYVTFDGTRLPSLSSRADVTIQPKDHRILVAGRTLTADGLLQCLARLNPDGTLDGKMAVTAQHDNGDHDTITLQADGRILVGAGGYVTFGNGNTLTVARYNPDLSPDASFGTAGAIEVKSLSGEYFAGLGLEPDGRIVEVGNPNSGYWRVDVARFLATEPQIGSFTASLTTAAAGDSVTLSAAALALNPGSTVTQVAFYVDSNNDGFLDPSSDTLLGFGVLTGGVWTRTFTVPLTRTSGSTYKLFAQAEDSYGVLSDPLSIDLQVL